MPKPIRILHFDMECLPGHWIGGDYVSKVVTAVAWGWRDDDTIKVLTHYDTSLDDMADSLSSAIGAADIVTGHYIRPFDLPLLNGALLRQGMRPLDPVLTIDTKLDLLKAHGRSKSQKNLSSMVGVAAPKVDLSNWEWEQFNLREPGFENRGIERVVGDVIQHKEMYAALDELGWLGSPRAWLPTSGKRGG